MNFEESTPVRCIKITVSCPFDLGIVLIMPEANQALSPVELNKGIARYCSLSFGKMQLQNGDVTDPEHDRQIIGWYTTEEGVEYQIVTREDRSFTIVSLLDEW